MKKLTTIVVSTGLVCLLALGRASAQTVCYMTDQGSDAGQTTAITANGYTPLLIGNIATFNFAGCNIVYINEASNGGYSAALLRRVPDLATYVRGGGSFIMNDRTVTNANTVLPGGGGISFTRDFVNGGNLDVVTPGTLLVNGPFGTINNTTLDGGNFSNHGFANAATLPAGAINLLSAGPAAANTAAFAYPLGAGWVYWASVPLDFYLTGNGTDPPATQFRTIYAPNMLNFEHALQVPEPTPLALLVGTGVVGLAARLRRRRQ